MDLDAFDQHLAAADLSDATRRAYAADVRGFAAWFERVHQNQAFSSGDVSTPLLTMYRATLTSAGRKPQTINRALISLKRYFAWLKQNGEIPHDPAQPVKLIEQVQPAPRCLTDIEETRLMAVMTRKGSRRDLALITLMLHTGLRVGEALALRRADLEIKERSGRVIVREGKGRKRREVPLNITARRALQPHLDDISSDPNKRVFSITARMVNHIVAGASRIADIDRVSAHDLRHRFAYRMAPLMRLDELARILGHENMNTTGIYTQPTAADLQRAVEKIAWE